VSTLYSVTGNESSDIFSLEVMGIQSFDDYVQVQNYLQNLAPVALVEMKRAEVENLSFDLVLRDSSDKFFQHLSLGRKLIKLEEPIFDTPRQDILLKPVHKFIWQSDIE
jgi:hypothetical protein